MMQKFTETNMIGVVLEVIVLDTPKTKALAMAPPSSLSNFEPKCNDLCVINSERTYNEYIIRESLPS